jgi:hypothetical protein
VSEENSAGKPQTKALTLYDVEEQYQALLDTEEMVAPDLEEEFKRELTEALRSRDEKRDRVLHVLLEWDSRMDSIDREIDRLKRAKEVISNARRRLGNFIVRVIKEFGTDAKGKYKKLDASLGTMYARALPESLEIIDEAIIPDRYFTARVDVPLEVWRALAEEIPELVGIKPKAINIDREKLMAALRVRDVPGADIKVSGHDYTLVVSPGVTKRKGKLIEHGPTEDTEDAPGA